jgi:hypothetical protein
MRKVGCGEVVAVYQRGSHTFLALDIEGFERADRDEAVQMRLRDGLYRCLRAALPAAGAGTGVDILDRGDGVVAVLPATVTAAALLAEGLPRLAEVVDADNRAAGGAAIMRLRVVVHTGTALSDGNGYIGPDVRLVFRLLDSDALRRRLEAAATDVVLAVTEAVRQELRTTGDAERKRIPPLDEALVFRTKETRQRAWVTPLGQTRTTGGP